MLVERLMQRVLMGPPQFGPGVRKGEPFPVDRAPVLTPRFGILRTGTGRTGQVYRPVAWMHIE
jgi:hypothetical protein